MRTAVTKQMLEDANVARRAMLPGETDAILRSMLHASDEGIMLTDLEHKTLACNTKFGEIFEIDPQQVVTMEPEDVRKLVYPKLRSPEEWLQKLMEVYEEPMRVYADQIELLTTPPKVIRRRSCPVLDARGEIIGRFWMFRDVTADVKREKMQEALYQLSTYQHPEPNEAMRFIVQQISTFYDGATAILSLRNGPRLDFRCAAGIPPGMEHVKGNTMKDSYCRVAIRTSKPIAVQDARDDINFRTILPAKVGLTRYVGAPIFDDRGRPIGTLCFLDSRSDLPLDEDDVRFISLLAMRISAELERERLVASRLASQKAVVEKQQSDLQTTHQVLTAMNEAFRMLAGCQSTEDVLARQVSLLAGLLGYSSAAILLQEEDWLVGCYSNSPAARPEPMKLAIADEPRLQELLQTAQFDRDMPMHFDRQPSGALGGLLGCTFVGVAPLQSHESPIGILALGSHSLPEVDARHLTHLEALIDEVSLVITSHVLQRRLLEAHDELRATHQRLVQSEKLSVVGTLAASIAHDIRNILSSLSLELASADGDPQETREAVKVQIDRFNVLAHRLLSYARPRLVSREECDLNEILRRVVMLTHAQAAMHGVDVISELMEGICAAQADTNQVEHLFVNLLMNAVQAIDARGGHVYVRSRRDGPKIVIELEDSGRGMTSEQKGKLFEPFHSTRSEGFGLGLYSVKRIVEEHGWKIMVESTPGQGTLFTVVIPQVDGRNGTL